MGAPFSHIDRFLPRLLPRTARIRTSSVEPPTFNVLGVIQRLRFGLIVSLLPKRRFHRLLEIGYGSGIFLPQLAQHCNHLYAIDIHRHAAQVKVHLRHRCIDAELACGSAASLPFDDKTFDCIVAVSCLEYMDQFEKVAQEIKRVLTPDGCFVFVTPGNSRLIDLAVKLLTTRSMKQHYGDRRDHLIPILLNSFTVQRVEAIPRVGGLLSFYRGMRLGVPRKY